MEWAILVPVAVALIAPVVTYVVAARKMSGKIATSDASELWEESRSIRDDYRMRLLQANERALSVEVRLASIEARNTDLERENYMLKQRIAELEEIVARLGGK